MSFDSDMAAILGELSGTPDAALVAAATETAKTTATVPANEYFSHLMAAHATTIADERSRREAAEKESLRSRGLFGWVVAGALSFVVIFLLVSKRT